MADEEHLAILNKGPEFWNVWRISNPTVVPDLSGVDLHNKILFEFDFRGVDFYGAELSIVNLTGANLGSANLRMANLGGANLTVTDLSRTDLREANLTWANLTQANVSGADLRGACLINTVLNEANFSDANLVDCQVYGVSTWNVKLDGANQINLVISRAREPVITVDNLEVAQFIYLLLNNEKIRDVINTITSKVVLILGRFTPERKPVLDALREELRRRNYAPILFDFDKPSSRDITETVRTLAHLARFIIADLTDPSSIPQELQAIVPDLAVPVQPLLLSSTREYSMFSDLSKKYHWVLPIQYYDDQAGLLALLSNKVISPAEAKATELEKR